MRALFTITAPPPKNLSDTMVLLQRASEGHSRDLAIDYDVLYREYSCLWMIVRAKVHLDRMPEKEIRIDTWLRKPSSVISIRDYAIYEGEDKIGYGLHAWTTVHAQTRKLVSLRSIPPVLEAPVIETAEPVIFKRIPLPDAMEETGLWIVSQSEIDSNGHVNNVCYIRHGEALCPGATDLEATFDRECFPGERLRLFHKDGYVCICKENGDECFRAHYWRNQE